MATHPTPVVLPGKSHGQRSLVGYENVLHWRLLNMGTTSLSLPPICRMLGEGNGNPLQYSCLDNPMGGGAWWAAVHGV